VAVNLGVDIASDDAPAMSDPFTARQRTRRALLSAAMSGAFLLLQFVKLRLLDFRPYTGW